MQFGEEKGFLFLAEGGIRREGRKLVGYLLQTLDSGLVLEMEEKQEESTPQSLLYFS